eukprot:GHVT01072389.1.p1 GENE.GHVT01072389.1~~GHVT01072389.1.p1  ORF type:complete len:275 (-),score=39.33 GHVT01072389.1:632-1456(-)
MKFRPKYRTIGGQSYEKTRFQKRFGPTSNGYAWIGIMLLLGELSEGSRQDNLMLWDFSQWSALHEINLELLHSIFLIVLNWGSLDIRFSTLIFKFWPSTGYSSADYSCHCCCFPCRCSWRNFVRLPLLLLLLLLLLLFLLLQQQQQQQQQQQPRVVQSPALSVDALGVPVESPQERLESPPSPYSPISRPPPLASITLTVQLYKIATSRYVIDIQIFDGPAVGSLSEALWVTSAIYSALTQIQTHQSPSGPTPAWSPTTPVLLNSIGPSHRIFG